MADQATDVVIRARYQDRGVRLGMTGVMGALRGIGMQLTLITGLAVGAAGALGVGLGAQVQKNLTTVGTIAGATAQELAGITAEARNIGATTAFTAGQAAEGMINLARAGLRPKQIIAATADTMRLAGATASDMGTATRSVAATLGQFALAASESQRVVDAFAYSTSRSLFDLPSLAEAMKYAGTTAKGLGMDLEDAVTAVSLFANLGLEGSMAGMAFRMAMIQLASGTDQVRDALKRAGIAWEDVNPATKSYTELIENLAKGHMDAATAVDVFGTRAGLNMLQVINGVRDGSIALRDFRQGILDAQQGAGLAAEQYGRMMDNLAGDWAILKSTLQESFLAMFDDYQGFLRRATRATTGFVRNLTTVYRTIAANFGAIMTSLKEFVVRLFTDYEFLRGIAGLVTEIWVRMSLAVGDFVWALGNIVIDAAAMVWAPFGAQFDFLLDTLAYKFDTWMHETLGGDKWKWLVKIAFESLPGGSPLPESFWEPPKFQPVMDEYWEKSGEEMAQRMAAIKAAFSEGLSDVAGRFEGLGEQAKTALAGILPKLKTVGAGLQELAEDADAVRGIIDPEELETVDQTARAVEALTRRAEVLAALSERIGKGFFADKTEVAILAEKEMLIEQITAKLKEIEALPVNENNLEYINALSQAYQKLEEDAKDYFESMYNAADGLTAKLRAVGFGIEQSLASPARHALNSIMDALAKVANGFSDFFADLVSNSKNAMRNFLANMIETVAEMAKYWGRYWFLMGMGNLFMGHPGASGMIAAGLGLMALGGVAQGLATRMRQRSESDLRAEQERRDELRAGVARPADEKPRQVEVTVNVQDNGALDSRGRREVQKLILNGLRGLQDQGQLQGALAR